MSTFWSDGVKLIKEQNAWLGRFGTFKQVAHRLFARTDILVQDFRALDADKVEAAFFRDSAGKERFSTSRVAVEQKTGAQAQRTVGKDGCILGRPFERFTECLTRCKQTANVGPLGGGFFQLHVTQRERRVPFLRTIKVTHVEHNVTRIKHTTNGSFVHGAIRQHFQVRHMVAIRMGHQIRVVKLRYGTLCAESHLLHERMQDLPTSLLGWWLDRERMCPHTCILKIRMHIRGVLGRG